MAFVSDNLCALYDRHRALERAMATTKSMGVRAATMTPTIPMPFPLPILWLGSLNLVAAVVSIFEELHKWHTFFARGKNRYKETIE